MTDLEASRRRWNAVRLVAGSTGGHYESWFQRANHPDRPLAFWIRYTIFSPKDRPREALGELWAIWFDGERDRITAVKQEEPLAGCRFGEADLLAQIGGATLSARRLDGSAASSRGHQIDWELDYEGGGEPLLLLPEAYYERPLPKAKALVGSPNATFRGALVVDGQRHEIDGWRGSQNHNWGSKHTDHYAWGQVAGFDGAPEAFLEVSTARIRLGPIWTPFLTLAVIEHDGQRYELNGLGNALRAQGVFADLDWTFLSETPEARLEGRIQAPPQHFVGLTYYNPPGGNKICMNSKIARCEVTLTPRGRDPVHLVTANRAAFEILADEGDPRVPVVV